MLRDHPPAPSRVAPLWSAACVHLLLLLPAPPGTPIPLATAFYAGAFLCALSRETGPTLPTMMGDISSMRQGFALLDAARDQDEADAAAEAGSLHPGVNCDACSTAIGRKLRYKCFTCPNYDLCQQCRKYAVGDHGPAGASCSRCFHLIAWARLCAPVWGRTIPSGVLSSVFRLCASSCDAPRPGSPRWRKRRFASLPPSVLRHTSSSSTLFASPPHPAAISPLCIELDRSGSY